MEMEMVIVIATAVIAIVYLVVGMKLLCTKLDLSEGTALLILGVFLAAIVCVVFCTPQSCDAAVLSSQQQSTSSLNDDETVVEEEGEVVERHELIPSPVTGEYLEKKEYERGSSSDIYYYYYLSDDGKTVVQGKLWWTSTTIRVGKEDSKAECVKYVRHEKILWGLIDRKIPHYVVTIPPKE